MESMRVQGRQIWKLPWFAVDGWDAHIVRNSHYQLELRWDDEPTGKPTLRIAFPGCEGYRVTYDRAAGLIGEGTEDIAWAHFAEITLSDWLDPAEVPPHDRWKDPRPPLRHFAVCLFDGPCFEFLAEGFSIEEDGKPVEVPDPARAEPAGDSEATQRRPEAERDAEHPMDDTERTRLSRFLSYALRHAPDRVGITLDAQGWADLPSVLEACNAAGPGATRDMILEVVRRCEKQRFEYDTPADRIRSVHGHSVEIDLALEPRTPPPVLYHGTYRDILERVLAEGLRPMRRRYVHLSIDVRTATEVGGRRGEPVVLRVDAAGAHAAGGQFFVSASGVWLTDCVAPEFISHSDALSHGESR